MFILFPTDRSGPTRAQKKQQMVDIIRGVRMGGRFNSHNAEMKGISASSALGFSSTSKISMNE